MKGLTVLLITGFVPVVTAQPLSLFEPLEGIAAQQMGPAPEQTFIPVGNGQPAFTLRSASRIGEVYHVVLLSRDGKVVQVDWRQGQQVPLPGFSFEVTDVSGRSVSLLSTGGESCVNAPQLGVRCISGPQAQLTLANSAPLAPSAQQVPQQATNRNVPDPFAAAAAAGAMGPPGAAFFPAEVRDAMAQGQQVVINPFSGQPEVVPQVSPEELAAREQRAQARAERLRQFVPPRIEDADVPEGMRKVSTPFGDRLVPIRE